MKDSNKRVRQPRVDAAAQYLRSFRNVGDERQAIGMPFSASHRQAPHEINPRNLRSFSGNLGSSAWLILVFFREETSMKYPLSRPDAGSTPNSLSRLDAMIAAAKAEIDGAQAVSEAATAEITAIEPHPHAHGYTAAGDCTYASIDPDHFLSVAGLLARPWQGALSVIETIQKQQGLDYLLKAFPAAIAHIGETLADDGTTFLDARRDHINQYLPDLYKRKPVLALGMIWPLFGFHRRDRDAWVGAFAYCDSLSALIGSTDGITEEMSLGDALAAVVAAHPVVLTAIGLRELHRRAAKRDAERQASWAEVPKPYREAGSWRGWAPSKRQRHLMQRIEAAGCLPTTATGRRGAMSDWIAAAGGNPRFNKSNEEQK